MSSDEPPSGLGELLETAALADALPERSTAAVEMAG